MFARDVITRQALENCLLPSDVQMEQSIAVTHPAATEDEMTPECAEEFEQTCERLAPLVSLALPDLHEQLQDVLASQRVK